MFSFSYRVRTASQSAIGLYFEIHQYLYKIPFTFQFSLGKYIQQGSFLQGIC